MFIVHDHNLILTGLQPGDGGPEELAKTVSTALIYLTPQTQSCGVLIALSLWERVG